MAALTISLPEALQSWLDEQVRTGRFASANDYILDLLRRDRATHGDHQLTLDELRQMIAEGDTSGISDKPVEEIFEEAMALAAIRARARA